MRQFVLDSNEAAFRVTGFENANDAADECVVKRMEHGFEPVRINRAGRCLVEWNEKLKAEKLWLWRYEQAVEEGKRIAREQEEADRKDREAEELREAAAKEADRERRKTRFMGSFNDLKWL